MDGGLTITIIRPQVVSYARMKFVFTHIFVNIKYISLSDLHP